MKHLTAEVVSTFWGRACLKNVPTLSTDTGESAAQPSTWTITWCMLSSWVSYDGNKITFIRVTQVYRALLLWNYFENEWCLAMTQAFGTSLRTWLLVLLCCCWSTPSVLFRCFIPGLYNYCCRPIVWRNAELDLWRSTQILQPMICTKPWTVTGSDSHIEESEIGIRPYWGSYYNI